MEKRFPITYETVTDESAENGDFAHHGFLPKSKDVPIYRDNMPENPALFTLKEAMELICVGITPCESDSCPCYTPRWITSQITEQWERPNISLSVHLDGHCSNASARRIGKLFRVYGMK